MTAPRTPTEMEIRDWIVAKLASELRCEPGAIDTGAPLTALGIESVSVFLLTGELADFLGCDLPANLFFEHPTIDQLVAHLAAERTRAE